jgi:hypothetical protein
MYATLALVHSHTSQRKRMMCTKVWPFDFHQHERILSRHHASDHTASVSICTFAPDRGARCSSSHSLTILSMGTKVPNADHVVSAPTCVHVRCCYQTIYLQCACVAPLAYQSCTAQCCCKCTVGSATECVSLFCVTISVAPQPCLRLQMCLPEVVPWNTTLQSSATASVAYFAMFVSAYTAVSRKVPCQNILTEKLLHWRHQAPPSDVHGRYDTWDAGRTEVGPRALRQPQKCRLPRQRRSCLQHCVFPTPF